MSKKIRLLLFFLFIRLSLYAQVYSFKTYSVEEGLPRSHVPSLFQDRQGNLWIGSAGGGVSRFDGKTFTTYSSKSGLVNNDINVIFQSSDSILWFGTNQGVSSFDGKKFLNFTRREGLCSDVIISIFEDRGGNIWFRSFEEGVSVLPKDRSELRNYTSANGLPDNVIFDIKEDTKGNVWFACESGLTRLDPRGEFKVYGAAEGIGGNRISSLLIDKKGTLFVGTWEAGVRVSEESSGKIFFRKYNDDPGLNSSIVLTMLEDKNGNILLATLGNGLVKLSKGKSFFRTSGQGNAIDYLSRIYQDIRGDIWLISSDESLFKMNYRDYSENRWSFVQFNRRNGLNDDRVITLFEDRESNMWFGTYTGGVSRYHGDLFTGFTAADGLSNSSVTAFCRDGRGRLWIGTDGGGVHLLGPDGRISRREKGKPSRGGFITSLLEDSGGNIWQGTADDGVSVHGANGELKSFTKYSGLLSNRIHAIREDKKKRIWICSDIGITRYDGRLQNFTGKEALGTKSIGDMAEAKNGELWFPGHDTILEIYSGGKFRHYRLPYKLSGTIAQGADGRMLLGTEDNGIIECSLDGKLTFRQIITAQQINYTTVNFLLPDEAGSLWIGTTKGLYRFDQKRYYREGVLSLKEYGKEEGLISIVTNKHAAYAEKSGIIWLGTINGAIRTDRKNIVVNQKLPETSITGIRLFFNDADLSPYASRFDYKSGLPEDLILPYSTNHLTFDFIGRSLTSPTRVRYKYRLKGLDDSWSPERQETSVTYPNLPPGEYTFMVIACNNDGVWNSVPAAFSFSITPPYWKTWWFISLSVLAVGAVLYFVYSRRVRNIRHTADLRQKILESEQKALRAQMNPHFIFNSLNSIQHFITDKDARSANRYLSKFSKLMRMILDNSKRPQISVAEELESLRLYLDLEALRFENKFEYEIDISEDVDTHSIEIPPMLIQPYLENAIWHGLSYKEDKGEIRIKFDMDGEFLVCSIEDNGIGRKRSGELKISHPAQHNSSGMRITSERLQSISALKSIKGSVEVIDLEDESGEGRGTLVKIRIPVD